MTLSTKPLIACFLLLSAVVGCGKTESPNANNSTTPQTVTSPQASTAPTTAASPQINTATAAGLQTIQGNGVKLSLPTSYIGGNPTTDLDDLSQKLKQINPAYEKRLEPLKQNPSAIALLAFDSKVDKQGFLTNVNVLAEKVPAGITVEQYMEAASKQLANQYKIEDQKVVSLEQSQAGRLIATASKGNTQLKQLFYVIPKGNTYWLVTYSTSAQEFDQRLPSFEQSVRSFAVQS